ncbi:MAG: PilZ domain-containing protein [Terracidiphilus sp.]
MPNGGYYLDSTARKYTSQHSAAESSMVAQPSADAGKHCAYNQSRERFLGSDVDAADFSITSLDERLPSLATNAGAGLWLLPFRGISPTSVRIPLDLIYLDQNCRVLETVESFPISRVSNSCPTAASVLVLAANTIRSTETQRGDLLILCEPEEMKRRLQELAKSNPAVKTEVTDAFSKNEPARVVPGRLLMWEDRLKAKDSAVEIPAPAAIPAEVPSAEPQTLFPKAQETAAEVPAEKTVKPAKSWLQRWLKPDPPDPRKALRESINGLSAYFFTGGAPVEHSVRDISLTGMYLLTEERWYPGTVVRMTLTDRMQATVEHSITMNVTVMRWGNDGVGLKFVVRNPKEKGNGMGSAYSDAMDIALVDQFIQRLKSVRG